ncbi:SMP-30/gluconolactonase/LRE family protein [Microvirga pudoricolor]|uniref:SMP-30/gluconolactonase/LRE family protein n=1 Tax=Microvirga pudoricolor TaxID=2778729 RepID=UPI00194DD35A|nr:SMP-30/gluconolactonase/LRE family protein [Microvirga pudoricolor]MBM6593592.1 SMP-30/gluconolactonase/LRE family protein [Microvirga pudoricolor]
MSESDDNAAARGTAALQKGLGILDALADGGGSMTFSEIGKATGLPKGTLHRILAALTDHGTIRFDNKDARYRFGWRLVEYARWSTAELDLKALAEPELIRLHALTGELIFFAVGERESLSCEQVVSNPQSYPLGISEGLRMPVYCTAAGKAVLAFMEPHRLDALVEAISFEPLTTTTIVDRDTFRAQLDVTKARRYAIEDQEWQDGLCSVAAPILDRANRPVGVIAIVGPAFRMSAERLHELGPDLLRSAQRITGQAAFTQPIQPPKAHMANQPSASCVVRSSAFLGEGPFWSRKDASLKWIDILAPAIHLSDPIKGSDVVVPMPEIVGAFAECSAGGLVIASQTGFSLFDPATGRKSPIGDPEADKPGNRFNDGKCDALGRFWAGTMDMAVTPGAGSLYRLDARGRIDRMETGIGISNGIGWSPDNASMYFTDSMARTIFVYDFDLENGTISRRRVFAQTPENMGVPDGLTVDAEGFVWSAQWDGWRIIRYAPDGTVDRAISVPVPRPTSCTFGGPDLSTLFITSARIRLSSQQLQEAPLSGSVFAIDTGVKGLPDHPFQWSPA